MMKFFAFFLILTTMIAFQCSAKCPNGKTYDSGVTTEEQQSIVEMHNNYRIELANGRVRGQPRAIDLKKMSWDEKLAKAAQDISNTCEFQHRAVNDNRFPVGQNIAEQGSTQYSKASDWKSAIDSWWNEYEVYHYPDTPAESTGHYTQMAWNDTRLIGCGYTYFASNSPYPYQKLYVCNYGPAGNFPREPYTTGKSGCETLC